MKTCQEAEQALVASEMRYRRLFESAKDGILILDAETGRVTDVNPYLIELLGYSHDEFCSKRLWELGAFRDIAANDAKFRKLQQRGYVRYEDVPLEGEDGDLHEVEFVSNVYESGGRQVIQCNIRDITRRKQSEARAQVAQHLTEAIINAIPVRVFWKDRELVYQGCNAAFARDAGFTEPHEVIGKDDFQMSWDDQAKGYRADDLEVIESGCPKLLFEESQTSPSGEPLTLLTSKVPQRNPAGEIIGVIGTYMDITAHKQVEDSHAQLAMAVEQAAEAVMITDTQGEIQYVNPAFGKVTGYTHDEAVGQNARLLKSGEQDTAFYTEMWDTLTAGKTWTGHLVNKRKDGTLYEEDASISPVRDASGTVVNYVAVKRDVTREARLEERLRQSQKMEALGQMASGLAHDFNNALSPILGFSDLLLRHPAKLANLETVTKYLKIIKTSAQDAASVVRRLREFGRQNGSHEMETSLDLVALVKETIVLTQPRWKDQALANGQTITVETDLHPVPPVPGEESSLRELLVNLILNAVDALPTGGAIRIQTEVEGETAVLRVSDTGTGMSEEVRQRCLEPFFSTKGTDGSGLGLAMVYGIVQRCHGAIAIASEPDHGTAFTIRLPLAKATDDPDDTSGVPALADQLHVLVVDDDPAVCEVLEMFLEEDGHTTETAVNGLEGLAALKKGTFDLVFTDKAMPKMNGEQLAAAIEEMAPDQPVIMLTGYGDLMKAAGELPTGVTFILSKPFTLDGLRSALAEAVRRT